MSENQLTGPLPESWGDMRQLTDLWVEYNKVRVGQIVCVDNEVNLT